MIHSCLEHNKRMIFSTDFVLNRYILLYRFFKILQFLIHLHQLSLYQLTMCFSCSNGKSQTSISVLFYPAPAHVNPLYIKWPEIYSQIPSHWDVYTFVIFRFLKIHFLHDLAHLIYPWTSYLLQILSLLEFQYGLFGYLIFFYWLMIL